MDGMTLLIWMASGAVVAGLIGQMRGNVALGMLCGLVLGPIFGSLLVMVLTLRSSREGPH